MGSLVANCKQGLEGELSVHHLCAEVAPIELLPSGRFSADGRD